MRVAQAEVRVAEDRDEQVVEVVREAAGEHAEALGALRVDHAVLECVRGGDVDRRADHADDRSPSAIGADRRSTAACRGTRSWYVTVSPPSARWCVVDRILGAPIDVAWTS